MKLEITQAQRQKYKEEGMVAFHGLIPDELFSHIAGVELGINHFESDPKILKILTLKQMGEMLFQLTDERPIRLVHSVVLEKGHVSFKRYPVQGHLMAVVIPAGENVTTVFASNTDYVVENKSLVALYGINDSVFIRSKEGQELQKHLQKKGYNQGDRLSSHDSPLVYR